MTKGAIMNWKQSLLTNFDVCLPNRLSSRDVAIVKSYNTNEVSIAGMWVSLKYISDKFATVKCRFSSEIESNKCINLLKSSWEKLCCSNINIYLSEDVIIEEIEYKFQVKWMFSRIVFRLATNNLVDDE